MNQIIIFSQLKPGDQFQCLPRADTYLKLSKPVDCCCLHNAVKLNDGTKEYFRDDQKVTQLIW